MNKLSGESENTASAAAAEIESDSPSTSSASRLSQDKTGDDKSKKQKHPGRNMHPILMLLGYYHFYFTYHIDTFTCT